MTTQVAMTNAADELPSFLRERVGSVATTGLEDMPDDFTIPRIQLAQAMSPQVKKRDPEYIPGLEEGMFFHALTRKVIGEQFIAPVLKIWNSRTLFTDENEVDCWSPDSIHGSKHAAECAACPLKDWGEDRTPPACKVFQNHLVVIDGEPAVLSIRLSNKAAVAEARKIRTSAKLVEGKGLGLFAGLFQFSALMVKGQQGSYFVTSAVPAGYVQSEEEYDRLAQLAEQLKDVNKPVAGFGPREGGE